MQMKPHRGGTVLTLGILAVVCNLCLVPGILAWVYGNQDLNEIDAGVMDPSGRQLTQVGQVLGMVGTGLALVAAIVASIKQLGH